jgi:hypothetical protein
MTATVNIKSYDHVFNFFDCRDYSERVLNMDFLDACKKSSKVVITIPQQIYDQDMNALIRVRMLDEFKRQLVDFKRESVKKVNIRLENNNNIIECVCFFSISVRVVDCWNIWLFELCIHRVWCMVYVRHKRNIYVLIIT